MIEENDDSSESTCSKTKDVIDAVTGLVQACPPIYEDGLQPVVKEAGKALYTIGKAVNVALAPVALSVWGYERVQEYLETQVAAKLEGVPTDRIVSPKANVVGPAIEALKYSADESELREMFANLIANSLDAETTKEVHPSFVMIIQSLSNIEAKILQEFINPNACYPLVDLKLVDTEDGSFVTISRNLSTLLVAENGNKPTSQLIDNLCRLGLLIIPHGVSFKDKSKYKDLDRIVNELDKSALKENQKIEAEYKRVELTSFGKKFVEQCVIDKSGS